MGKVLSSFTNGWAGSIARNRDDVVVALDETKTGVVPFDGNTHTGADFVGVTVRLPSKTPDTYGSNEGKYAANEMVDVLVRGHIVAKVITGKIGRAHV